MAFVDLCMPRSIVDLHFTQYNMHNMRMRWCGICAVLSSIMNNDQARKTSRTYVFCCAYARRQDREMSTTFGGNLIGVDSYIKYMYSGKPAVKVLPVLVSTNRTGQ